LLLVKNAELFFLANVYFLVHVLTVFLFLIISKEKHGREVIDQNIPLHITASRFGLSLFLATLPFFLSLFLPLVALGTSDGSGEKFGQGAGAG
jgi:hypothetical protein